MSVDLAQRISQLTSGSLPQQQAAVAELAKLGTDAAGAAAALALAAGSQDETVQNLAASALESLGPPPVSLTAELTGLLGHQHGDVAYWAATLLGRLEAEAAPAVERLSVLLVDGPHLPARQQAARALGQIGPAAKAAASALESAAASDDKRLARLAGEALQRIRG